jgi:hypothetical protein
MLNLWQKKLLRQPISILLVSKLVYYRNYVSPFTIRAFKSGYKYMGGKSDDITVIVAEA